MNGCPRVGCWFGDGLASPIRSIPNYPVGWIYLRSVSDYLAPRFLVGYPRVCVAIRRLVRLVGYPRLAASNQTRSKLFKRSRAIRRVSGMFLRMIRRNQIPLLNWRSIQKGEKNAYWCSKSKLSSSW